MVTVESSSVALALCVLTMLCWGSHANTLKMVPQSYGFPLYYWDQAIGYLLLPLIVGFTLGSLGSTGRSLIPDLVQGTAYSYAMAICGGIVFNLANILFVSAVDIAGMAVAFPIGIGIALVEGILINYVAEPRGNSVLILAGTVLITLAIVTDALAYRRLKISEAGTELRKGILLACFGGILMGLFYYLVQRSVSPNFRDLEPGRFGPYAAVLVFSAGSFLSNLVFNGYLMAHPFRDGPVTYSDYFASGNAKLHLIGILGGGINALGTMSNFAASKTASPAIAYGLGQGGAMVAAIWGVFLWKDFKGAPKGTNRLIAAMFCLFITGLMLLMAAVP